MDYHATFDRLNEIGKEWAAADAEASRLEELKKHIYGAIAIHFMKEEKCSATKAELAAAASQKYADHIEKMISARKTANEMKATYDAAKISVEVWRSQESTERAKINLR